MPSPYIGPYMAVGVSHGGLAMGTTCWASKWGLTIGACLLGLGLDFCPVNPNHFLDSMQDGTNRGNHTKVGHI